MGEYKLVEPTQEYRDEYINMINEWEATGERMVPFVLRIDYTDFDIFLKEIDNLKTGTNLGEDMVKSSTYWLVNSHKMILGAVNIRHNLNHQLLEIGGHIGYGIRPSARLKGNATRLLKMALDKAKILDIKRALVTCDKDNIGSAKTIINNGGVLETEGIINGIEIQRYWIELD